MQCVWTCACVSIRVYTCVHSYIYYLHNKRCSNWVIGYHIIWLIKITTQVPHRITHISKVVVLLPLLLLTIARGNTYWRQIMCQISICIGLLNSHKKPGNKGLLALHSRFRNWASEAANITSRSSSHLSWAYVHPSRMGLHWQHVSAPKPAFPHIEGWERN